MNIVTDCRVVCEKVTFTETGGTATFRGCTDSEPAAVSPFSVGIRRELHAEFFQPGGVYLLELSRAATLSGGRER